MNEKVESILDKHCEHIEETAKEIVKELKQECETYGDSDNAINRMERDIRWDYSNAGKYESLINEIKRLVEDEKNNLKISKEPFKVMLKVDTEQIKDIDKFVEMFEDFKKSKRAGVIE